MVITTMVAVVVEEDRNAPSAMPMSRINTRNLAACFIVPVAVDGLPFLPILPPQQEIHNNNSSIDRINRPWPFPSTRQDHRRRHHHHTISNNNNNTTAMPTTAIRIIPARPARLLLHHRRLPCRHRDKYSRVSTNALLDNIRSKLPWPWGFTIITSDCWWRKIRRNNRPPQHSNNSINIRHNNNNNNNSPLPIPRPPPRRWIN
mmetsp:Transcript_16008/g.37761  ORF Transcript_16008/g.37761 Transcript_16008/m.37761 type:complete len:203 (-) Transcript_16008:1691-2299(-)